MSRLSEISGKLDMLTQDADRRRRIDSQIDRMAQQLGSIASIVQSIEFERDEGNGLTGARVLIVDDNEELCRACERMLHNRGCKVVSLAHTADEAYKIVEQVAPEDAATHAIIDLRLGRDRGGDVARFIRERWPDTAIVTTTGYSDETVPAGVSDFELLKSFRGSDLARAIERTWRLDRPPRLNQ